MRKKVRIVRKNVSVIFFIFLFHGGNKRPIISVNFIHVFVMIAVILRKNIQD